ncbi:hypothetical protein B0T10DRAFT_443602 [Thelonectria olida]|uniref:Lysophospholipase A n=1 Tax=Thelonectria olida TaxID=1576542 RepID=A0A9P8W180_9HYPO|nr:hypothetical protein B0T10DRAFT_443602 [Thelonectria olida]
MSNTFKWSDTKSIIAFGDSYTYVQGTRGYPKYSFIGDYENNFSFTPEELLSNEIIQSYLNGTSAGGPNWVEYISGCGVKEGLTLPSACKVQLWDFAFAGANTAEKFLPLHHAYTIPMVNQTQQYLTYAEPVLKTRIDKAKSLVAIWIGINDINDSASLDVDLSDFYEQNIAFMFEESVTPLYGAGYRNFLFVNLPPLHRTPSNQKKANPLPNATMIGWWNSHLSDHSARFSRKHKSAKTMVYDSFSFLNKVLDNPEKYHITNTTDFCPGYKNATVVTDPEAFGCTPIDGYFWFDSGHITSHVHKLLAKDLEADLKSWSS